MFCNKNYFSYLSLQWMKFWIVFCEMTFGIEFPIWKFSFRYFWTFICMQWKQKIEVFWQMRPRRHKGVFSYYLIKFTHFYALNWLSTRALAIFTFVKPFGSWYSGTHIYTNQHQTHKPFRPRHLKSVLINGQTFIHAFNTNFLSTINWQQSFKMKGFHLNFEKSKTVLRSRTIFALVLRKQNHHFICNST